jgi:hypothetical protein
MDYATLLLNLLAGAAGLAASGAPGAFGQGPGKAALDALTARLEEEHDVETLSLLPQALASTGARQAILSELVDPGIALDPELATQAEILRAELERLPEADLARAGLTREILQAGRDVIAQNIEGAIGRSWEPGQDPLFDGAIQPEKP